MLVLPRLPPERGDVRAWCWCWRWPERGDVRAWCWCWRWAQVDITWVPLYIADPIFTAEQVFELFNLFRASAQQKTNPPSNEQYGAGAVAIHEYSLCI